MPVSLPSKFTLLCQSLLARDPVYGRLMNGEFPTSYDGLAGWRFSNEQENSPFLLSPQVTEGHRTYRS